MISQVERLENDRIVKTVYVGVSAGSHQWVGRGRDGLTLWRTVLRKKGLDIRKGRRMV